jgi:hypothetical protein
MNAGKEFASHPRHTFKVDGWSYAARSFGTYIPGEHAHMLVLTPTECKGVVKKLIPKMW